MTIATYTQELKDMFMRSFFQYSVFCFLCLISMQCNSQELRRKASLGIQMSLMSDSISKVFNTPKGKGLYIPFVSPNSTADDIGLKDESVLLKVNGNEVNDFSMLRSEIEYLRDGDSINLTYCKAGETVTKSGKAIGRPYEQFEQADILYGEVNYKENQLRSILYTPKNIENPPVVFYIQGYLCQTVEYLAPQDITIKRLINDWVLAGYAVFRVEKPGMGDSNCKKGCVDIDFNEEIEAFRQGYLSLRKNKMIDSKNIFLFGHSLGGVVAPVLAKEFSPRGVMTYGTVVNSWFEYMQDLTRVQGEVFSTPYAEIERDVIRSTPFWYQLLVEGKSNEEILQDESISIILKEEGILEEFRKGYFMGRHYTYWSTLNSLSMVNTWLEVESPVLAIHGALDVQALHDDHVKTIAAIVNSAHPGNGGYLVIPNMDHGFVYFETMQDNVDALNSGAYSSRLRDSYHDKISQSTVQWMKIISAGTK